MSNQEIKVKFTEQQLNNLITFLDRLEYKGLKEVQALNEIMATINSPIQEEDNK